MYCVFIVKDTNGYYCSFLANDKDKERRIKEYPDLENIYAALTLSYGLREHCLELFKIYPEIRNETGEFIPELGEATITKPNHLKLVRN